MSSSSRLSPLLSLMAFVLVALASLTLYVSGMAARKREYDHHRGADAAPWPWVSLFREVQAMLVVSWWHIVHHFTRYQPSQPSSEPPVLCVHGYTQNASNWVRLRRQLRDQGRITYALSMGLPPREQESYARRLRKELGRIIGAHGRVDIVCHSMGGLVLRRVLEQCPEFRPNVRKVITLGTPHQGTASTRGFRFRELGAMGRRQPYLQELSPLDVLLPEAEIMTIGGADDWVVYPVKSTLIDGASQVVLQTVGHAGLLVHEQSLGPCRQFLKP